MSDTYVMGDVQFQALNAWNYEAGNRFLDWFDSLDVPKGSTLIQVGDMTEKDTNPGDVVRQLERFFQICARKFDKTYVLVGNHDLRMYHGRSMVSFAFAEEKDKIEVVRSLSCIKIGTARVLAMPFFRPKGKTLHDFYNSKSREDYLKLGDLDRDYDLCVGHWQKQGEEGSPSWARDGVDTSRLPVRKFMLGHIHDRPDPDYLGSLWPLKVSEQRTAFPRVLGVMRAGADEDEVSYSEIPVPTFCDYGTVTYPEKIEPTDDGITHVYTVENCSALAIAQAYYPGLHIRATSSAGGKEDIAVASEEAFSYSDFVDAFKKYMDEKKPKVSRNAIRIVTSALKRLATD